MLYGGTTYGGASYGSLPGGPAPPEPQIFQAPMLSIAVMLPLPAFSTFQLLGIPLISTAVAMYQPGIRKHGVPLDWDVRIMRIRSVN